MKKMAGILTVLFVFALSACEGDGGGDGEEEKCKTKLDGSKVWVDPGTVSIGGDLVVGDDGATDPGATVTITDSEGKSVERTANDEGGFAVPIAALKYKRGDCVTLTVKVDDCEPVSMEVCIPRPGE